MKVLYVEDNPLNMRLVRKFLRSAGIDMIEAMDGMSGVDMAVNEQPDVILMDINLPDIDGIEATAHLKAMPQTQHIPVIALTANAMHGDREHYLASGCDDYLAKPITRGELLNALRHFSERMAAVS